MQIINESGLVLELPAGSSITVERNNALFSTDGSFAQDLTYPGQAGLTDSNKIFINAGHLVEAKNEVYEFPVQVIVGGYQFFKAIFSYKIVNENIEYILKVNFGAVVSKMKNAILQDIYTTDPIPAIGSAAQMAAYMKDTCQNPKNYNFAFFPVYNESWNNNPVAATSKWINEWDHASQAFKTPPASDPLYFSGIAPFFKLSYMLKKVFEYLKLNISGNYLTSPEAEEIYIYTQKTVSFFGVGPSTRYMPHISVNDFLKQVSERTKISFSFDLLNNTVMIETPESALNSTNCNDISDYIESIDEKSVADQKGYYITLKVDESDEAMNRGTLDEKNFTPAYALLVGNGETKVEMAIGTLAMKTDTSYSYPISNQVFNTIFGEVTDWPIRLIKYQGLKNVTGGVFPAATAMNLEAKDADWYRFLNDSKKVIISASIPPGVLAKITPNTKIGAIDDQGNFFYALPKKISYALTNNTFERISVKIEAHTIVRSFITKYEIVEIQKESTDQTFNGKVKAFWIPEIHGFTEFRVECVSMGNATDTFGYIPITSPTDDGGISGVMGSYFFITMGPRSQRNYQIRCYSPVKPRYYILGGFKGYFTKVADYFTFDALPAGSYAFDNKPIWIVF